MLPLLSKNIKNAIVKFKIDPEEPVEIQKSVHCKSHNQMRVTAQ